MKSEKTSAFIILLRVVSHVCIECVIGIFSLLEKDILKILRVLSARQTPQCCVKYKLKLVGLNLYSVKRLAKSNTNRPTHIVKFILILFC